VRPVSLLVFVPFVALVCACAKAQTAPASPTPPAPRADVTARDAVLTLADMPSGWQSEPLTPDATSSEPGATSDSCSDPDPPANAVAALEIAQSEFLSGPTEEASNTTWRFASAADARTQFQQLAETYDRCRDASVAASKTAFAADPASSDLKTTFSVEEIGLPLPGADVRAFRSTVAAFSGGEQVDGQVVDVVFIRSGALVSILTHTSVSPDMTLLKSAAARLAKKMSGQSP
jgi:hypothetical protein